MTKVFTKNKNDFYDDYAHHPTEISSILEGCSQCKSQKEKSLVFLNHIDTHVSLSLGK